MATRTQPPFRADHVGSLLRPPELHAARMQHRAGAIGDEALAAAEDAAVRSVIAMQGEAGLRTVTDGELRRRSWHMDFITALDGIELDSEELVSVRFRNAGGTIETPRPAKKIRGRIGLPSVIFAPAFAFLRENARAGQVPKLTIPSPSMVHFGAGDTAIDRTVYPDVGEFWSDLLDAYTQQIDGLHALGCRYLQLDDISLAHLVDPVHRDRVRAVGGDADHLHEQYIANINTAIAGRPDDLRITTHLCRGNNQSMWAAEGGYDFVAEALFGDLQVDGYFLEFDDERSGTFEPLRFLPKGDKQIVLGLVTTKTGALESKDELKRRIDEATRYVDIEQLCLSPQCGFSSTEEGNDLTEDEQKAKLALIVEVADEVWG